MNEGRNARLCATARVSLTQLARSRAGPALASLYGLLHYPIAMGPRAGQKVLRLKGPYQEGSTHVVMSALEFMQRLAALVPRPRLHLIRFHSVLAPDAKLRSAIVPQPAQPSPSADHVDTPGLTAAARISWARLLKRGFDCPGRTVAVCPYRR